MPESIHPPLEQPPMRPDMFRPAAAITSLALDQPEIAGGGPSSARREVVARADDDLTTAPPFRGRGRETPPSVPQPPPVPETTPPPAQAAADEKPADLPIAPPAVHDETPEQLSEIYEAVARELAPPAANDTDAAATPPPAGDRPADGPPPPDSPPPAEAPSPGDNPSAIHAYRITAHPEQHQGRETLAVPPESELAARNLEFVSRGRQVPGTEIGYPDRMEIRNVITGVTEVWARAVRHESQRPVDTGVVEDGSVERTIPEPGAGQRSAQLPPDELILDVLTEEPHTAQAVVKAVLDGYATDVIRRLTEPSEYSPGNLQFTPAATDAGLVAAPFSEIDLRDSLIGDDTLGITRIVLSDTLSDARGSDLASAIQRAAMVNGVLAKFGCEPTGIRPTRADGFHAVSGVEIRFRHRPEGARTIEGAVVPTDQAEVTIPRPRRRYLPGQIREILTRLDEALPPEGGVSLAAMPLPGRLKKALPLLLDPTLPNAAIAELLNVRRTVVSVYGSLIIERALNSIPAELLPDNLPQPGGSAMGEGYDNVGWYINDIRKEQGVTIAQLAAEQGLSLNAFMYFFNGTSHPMTEKMLIPLLDRLHITGAEREEYIALYNEERAEVMNRALALRREAQAVKEALLAEQAGPLAMQGEVTPPEIASSDTPVATVEPVPEPTSESAPEEPEPPAEPEPPRPASRGIQPIEIQPEDAETVFNDTISRWQPRQVLRALAEIRTAFADRGMNATEALRGASTMARPEAYPLLLDVALTDAEASARGYESHRGGRITMSDAQILAQRIELFTALIERLPDDLHIEDLPNTRLLMEARAVSQADERFTPGAQLGALLQEAKWSQARVARYIEISASTVSRIFSNEVHPSTASYIIPLLRELNVPPEVIERIAYQYHCARLEAAKRGAAVRQVAAREAAARKRAEGGRRRPGGEAT